MTKAELKTVTDNALKQAYSAQVMTLYSVLSSKLVTARGSEGSLEATRQFQRGLELAEATYMAATKSL
jgi:hypothetical protein